jgi:uncharacterized protein (TIGR02231 family)
VIDTPIPSTASRVTFFEDRAEVQRKATFHVSAGTSWVALSGVSVAIDDSSLVAHILGDSTRVIATRVTRKQREQPTASASEIEVLLADKNLQKARLRRAKMASRHADVAVRRAQENLAAWTKAVRDVPRGDNDPQAATQRWRSAWDTLDAQLGQCLQARAVCYLEHENAKLADGFATQRYNQGRQLKSRDEALVEVQIEAREAREIDVEISYRTPCALWRPEHRCHLVAREGGGHEMVVRTCATVWQCTGEVWENVACRFSTARPAQQAAAPLLTEDVLVLRRKTERERQVVTVEARDQSVSLAGLQRGVRAVNEMPGVEDGGEALWFDAQQPATIVSDGAPVRVELGETKLLCEVDRIAYPEQTVAVHVRATATLSAPWPLLAGPVVVCRSTEIVGRGRATYVGRGEPFEMGFGVDDGLRVRRTVDERREQTTLLGTQKVTRTVKLFVSNVSGQEKKLTVTERVPVSEVKDVEVIVVQTGGGKHDTKDGFIRWEVEVSPRGTQEFSLVYRIEAASKVNLNF